MPIKGAVIPPIVSPICPLSEKSNKLKKAGRVSSHGVNKQKQMANMKIIKQRLLLITLIDNPTHPCSKNGVW